MLPTESKKNKKKKLIIIKREILKRKVGASTRGRRMGEKEEGPYLRRKARKGDYLTGGEIFTLRLGTGVISISWKGGEEMLNEGEIIPNLRREPP